MQEIRADQRDGESDAYEAHVTRIGREWKEGSPLRRKRRNGNRYEGRLMEMEDLIE